MALIGTIALNMRCNVAPLAKGLKTAASAVGSFAKAAGKLGATIGSKLIGAANTEGVKSIGQAFLDARDDARTLSKAGLLDLSNRLRIVRNLASDLAPALGGLAGRALRGIGGAGLMLAGAGLRAAGSAATLAGRALANASRFAGELAAKLGIVAGLGGAAVYKVATAASGLAEQTDRARIIFGDFAGEVIRQANVMGEAFGASRTQFIESASEMGGMFKGAGYSAQQASQLAVHFAKLSQDVASATQTTREEAARRMMSGLSGEAEAVRRWGVDVSEAALKLRMLSMGMVATKGEFSQQQKLQARVAILTEKLAYANGNLALTANGAENATRGFLGRLQNLAETVGTALLPVVGTAMTELSVGVQVLSMAWSDWTRGAVSEQVGVVGSVGVTTESVGYLQRGVIYVADAWNYVKGVFGVVQSYITSGLAKIVEVVGYLAGSLDAIAAKLGMTKTGIGDVIKTYGEDLRRLSDQQFMKAGQALTAPSAAGAVDDYFARAQDRIKAMRAEAAKPGVDVTALKPAESAESAAGKSAKAIEPKFASAATAGSAEATNAILRSRYGGGGAKGPADQTARNTAKANDLLSQAVAGINRLAMNKAESAGGALGSALGALF